MLAQFQSLYPTGSLISELVQIYHGKYIVRVSLQIEGVTRATGMAAAEKLEVAEDRARSRALMVVGIQSQLQANTDNLADTEKEKSKDTQSENVPVSPRPHIAAPYFAPSQQGITRPETEATPLSSPSTPAVPVTSESDTYNHSQDLGENFPPSPEPEPQLNISVEENLELISSKEPESTLLPEITSSNVKPFAPRSHSSQEDTGSKTAKKNNKNEPVDFSDPIAKIDVEMQRLGWTTEQGREHLKQTYNKRARSLLTDEELLHFLKYLESQPTPKDPLIGF